MSEVSEKLQPVSFTPGQSRQTLTQLRTGWGRLTIVDGDENLPLRIIRTSMGRWQLWTHLSGTGPKAIYELQREA